MNNEQNRANFNKCLDFIRERIGKLNGRKLYIGYGDRDDKHYWNEKEFQNRMYSLQINDTWHNLDIQVMTYGCFTMNTYGFEKTAIADWEDHFKGTGMSCPHNRFTWEELDVVPFLLDWMHIKEVFLAEIAKYETLNDFEV